VVRLETRPPNIEEGRGFDARLRSERAAYAAGTIIIG